MSLFAARSSAAPTPAVSFGGQYVVTFTVTNAKGFKPTRWSFGVVSTCSSPCRRVSFRQRLATESAWRSFVLEYTWSGTGYALRPLTQRAYADCRGAKGATVTKGYDVVSTQVLRPKRAVNGRVTSFVGSGRDTYVVNQRGRKGGCAAGVYTFDIAGRAA